jgi:hypothetical protein
MLVDEDANPPREWFLFPERPDGLARSLCSKLAVQQEGENIPPSLRGIREKALRANDDLRPIMAMLAADVRDSTAKVLSRRATCEPSPRDAGPKHRHKELSPLDPRLCLNLKYSHHAFEGQGSGHRDLGNACDSGRYGAGAADCL